MSRSLRALFLATLLVIVLCGPARSQRYDFRDFSVEDGLAQSQAYALCQDRRGYLWIGTIGGGACRFDGRSFVRFTTRDGLGSDTIMAIIEDSNGVLWFGAYEGSVTSYDGRSFTVFDADQGFPVSKSRYKGWSISCSISPPSTRADSSSTCGPRTWVPSWPSASRFTHASPMRRRSP